MNHRARRRRGRWWRGGEQRGEFGNEFRMGGIAGEVAGFFRIPGMVVEFAGADASGIPVAPFGVAVGAGPHRAADDLAFREIRRTRVLGVGGCLDGGLRVLDHRAQGDAVERVGRGEAAEVGERGIDIDQFDDRFAGASRPWHAGFGNDERHARVGFEVGELADERVFADLIAVVAPEHDDRVAGKIETIEFVEDFSDLRVEITDRGKISVAEMPDGGGGQRAVLGRAGVAAGLGRAVAGHRRRAFGPFRRIRPGDRLGLIEIPVFLRRVVRHVGFPETHGEEEWFVLESPQRLDRGGGDAAVEIGLVRDIERLGDGQLGERHRLPADAFRLVDAVVAPMIHLRAAP